MKKIKKVFSLLLVVIMAITSTSTAFAISDLSENEPLSERDQLQADIAVIESVGLDNLQEFYNQNKDWIEDVNNRLEAYLANIPVDQRDAVLKELRDGEFSARAASDYFTSYTYHYRSGWWTYSMTPKLSTRLLRPYAQAGWDELAAIYSGIRNDNGSLSNQYWCHFDLFVEADWDIEEGRPLVSYADTLLALCNPGGGGD